MYKVWNGCKLFISISYADNEHELTEMRNVILKKEKNVLNTLKLFSRFSNSKISLNQGPYGTHTLGAGADLVFKKREFKQGLAKVGVSWGSGNMLSYSILRSV